MRNNKLSGCLRVITSIYLLVSLVRLGTATSLLNITDYLLGALLFVSGLAWGILELLEHWE